MPEDSINKITVYKLNIDNFDNIGFQYYKMVKSDVFSIDNNSYPYKLFFFTPSAKTASWFPMFAGLGLTIMSNEVPAIQVSGFILVLKIENSFYAVTGGVGHIHLKKTLTVEHRFGIIIAEKILSMPELKGLTQKDTSGNVNYIDRVFRGFYNPIGDINNLKRVLTHVRGKFKKGNRYCQTIGKSISASNALSVNGSKTFGEIVRFLLDVESLWQTTTKKISIPQLEHIDKKFNGRLLNELQAALVDNLGNYTSDGQVNLYLDNADIGYLPDRVQKYTLVYNRNKHPVDTYEEVFEKVSEILRGIQNIEDKREAFAKINLEVTFDDNATEKKELLYFICGDITYNNEVYFISNKLWYKANNEFLKQLDGEIDNIRFLEPEAIGLIEWDSSRHREERSYNDAHTDFVKLDRRLIKIPEEKGGIEFCDLYKTNPDGAVVIHVKHDYGAALRALFAQGDVSAQLYAQSKEFRDSVLNARFTDSNGLDDNSRNLLGQLAGKQKIGIKIVYAIYDDRPSHTVSQNAKTTSEKLNGTLTTFAKVDLLSRINNIRSMGYDTAITRIKPYPQ